MRAKLLTLLLTLSAAVSTLVEEDVQNCPDESWIYFNNFCYKIVTQKRTFQHAEQECAKLNAELFFPPSVSEFGKIVLTIPHSKEFWIDTTLRKNPIWINNPTLDPIQKLYFWPKRLSLKEDVPKIKQDTKMKVSFQLFNCAKTIAQLVKEKPTGQVVAVKGWVKRFRSHKNFTFMQISDGLSAALLQVVIPESLNNNSHITVGSAVAVEGELNPSVGPEQHLELVATQLNVVAHNDRKINNFVYIDTPVLTANDCEAAGDVFTAEKFEKNSALTFACDNMLEGNINEKTFFGRKIFLTVSGQLHLEAAACGLNKVYTFNPTFRAESSLTRQHLAEFYMLEVEQAFCTSLEDLMKLVENLILNCIRTVMHESVEDLKICQEYHQTVAFDDLCRIEKLSSFPRITFVEAAEILQNSNKKFSKNLKHLRKEDERFLVQHFGNLPLFVTEYPAETKPFYMKRNEDNTCALCFDLLVPHSGEVCGGSLRECNLDILSHRMKLLQIAEQSQWYSELRKFGYPDLGGFGLGFERLLQFFIGIRNIKDCIPFPRWFRHCST
ncbi:putative asparagine--tRNA ligase, mitochondrial [Trichinella pseudospiralis]|uniref:Putative asparagine--tRNA ligase, mitochondrial n=1 Tax=Trichinella pseudospiralis TaxID=6337 RepID=A0A0V1K302_TRIPS|nr:putative asparagine--tRNA ligase, mitochondrial [Trichinella pseudospiralis]